MSDSKRTDIDFCVEAHEKDIDHTLSRKNLALTVPQRLDELIRLQELVEGARRAARRAHSKP